MKEFLPVLIGLAYFGIQIFMNYKKEQEKALKRNPSNPTDSEHLPKTNPYRKSSVPTEPDYFPEWMKQQPETRKPRQNRTTTVEQQRTTQTSSKNQRQKPLIPSVRNERKESMNREVELPEEVLRLRAFKEQKRQELLKKGLTSSQSSSTSKTLRVEILDNDHKSKSSQIDFDLEKAVIQSIILERKHF